jgi:hypothetical protein
MSDWTIRRNSDGTIDEIVAHGVDLHLEQTDKNAWSFNVYVNEAPSQGDNNAPFLQATFYSKKRVTVFVEEGQDVYPIPTDTSTDEATKYTPPSMENLSKSVAIDDDLEAVAAAVGAFVEAGNTSQQITGPEPVSFIKFPSGEITP